MFTRCPFLLLAFVAVGACAPAPQRASAAPEANCHPGFISDSAVAGLPIGASVASVKQHCRVLEDTTALGSEAQPERTLLVEIGSDSLVAVIDSDKVWRIEIVSPRLNTKDSLRVGIRLSRLLRDTSAHALIGEGSYYVVMRSHCGLSFALPSIELSEPTGDLDAAKLRELPDTLRIQEILVVGCSSDGAA